ncbi:endoplasmic reticulum metallopeptidase 1-like [Drosophila miranda]|uniref:endoplasmic reticulum metallopeptidase 1-like n=1 Tax=Drosophila miranda TaxID=7229 RepID=UPI00143F2181|nr:endoplasmic reticulum metallopeptidase 1-like [Drosophila miranda]
MIFYTEATSIIVNVVVSLLALMAIGISLYFMSVRSGCSWKGVLLRYAITIGMQLAALALAVGLALLVAVFMDRVIRSMTWFTSTWTIFGLYLAPIIFGMSILPALYLEKTKRDPLVLGFRIQLFMHSHCFWLIVIMVTLAGLSIRSAYLIMLYVLFDIVALIVNLVTKCHRKAYLFAIAVTVCQILPFVYFTYLCTAALLTLMHMQGRFFGYFAGYFPSCLRVPLIMFFRKTRTIVLCFLGITILFIVIAVTNAGFPYKEKTSAQRYSLIHAHRRLHNADGTTRMDESEWPQDRH